MKALADYNIKSGGKCNKKTVRRVLALGLTLSLIFACALSVAAIGIGQTDIVFADLLVCSYINVTETKATASFDIDLASNLEALVTPEVTSCHSIISISYKTWPEDQQHPDYIETQNKSKESYTTDGASFTINAKTDGHISKEATASFYMYIGIQTGSYETFTPDDLYMEYT